jgi:processive 1,2-diacylglycerol beta-glucosyltransferase
MIQMRDKETGALLGSVSEEDLQFLIDNLVEESDDDTDYYLNRATIDMLSENGAGEALIKILNDALGDKKEAEIEWVREE